MSATAPVEQPTASRALTINQPWASLIVHGLKDVENRSWSTSYRGPLFIHAGMADDPEGYELIDGLLSPDEVPHGAIIGVVGLVDVVTDSTSEWAIPGDYHWVLENARLIEPVPARGNLSLWTPSADVCRDLSSGPALP